MLPTIHLRRVYLLRHCTTLTVAVWLLSAPLLAAPLTAEDRQHLLVHLEMTTQMVGEQVRGLSPAQLEYNLRRTGGASVKWFRTWLWPSRTIGATSSRRSRRPPT